MKSCGSGAIVGLVGLAFGLAGCSSLKSGDGAQGEAGAPATQERLAGATPEQIGALAELLMGSTRKKIPAARVEQLTKADPDYSFCRGTRCPPRTPKQVVYSNDPEVQLKGITQRGDGAQVAMVRPAAAVDRRTLTIAAFGSDGALEAAAREQVAALARKHSGNRFQVIYVVLANSTPQDELKATKRGVELERALIAAGASKSRIELRAEKAEVAPAGRVAEVVVLPAQ